MMIPPINGFFFNKCFAMYLNIIIKFNYLLTILQENVFEKRWYIMWGKFKLGCILLTLTNIWASRIFHTDMFFEKQKITTIQVDAK